MNNANAALDLGAPYFFSTAEWVEMPSGGGDLISQFYVEAPKETILRIQEIENFLDSEIFLAGIMGNPPKYSGVFSRISEFGLAYKMSCDQSIWDRPRPWPHEYFPAILEDELKDLSRKKMDVAEIHAIKTGLQFRKEGRSSPYLNAKPLLQEAIYQKVGEILTVERVLKHWGREKFPKFAPKFFISEILPNMIYDHFSIFLRWAHLLPFEDSPKISAFMSAYRAGGIPIGWINDTQDIQEIIDPEDEDYDEFWEDETVMGDPLVCLNVLHLG